MSHEIYREVAVSDELVQRLRVELAPALVHELGAFDPIIHELEQHVEAHFIFEPESWLGVVNTDRSTLIDNLNTNQQAIGYAVQRILRVSEYWQANTVALEEGTFNYADPSTNWVLMFERNQTTVKYGPEQVQKHFAQQRKKPKLLYLHHLLVTSYGGDGDFFRQLNTRTQYLQPSNTSGFEADVLWRKLGINHKLRTQTAEAWQQYQRALEADYHQAVVNTFENGQISHPQIKLRVRHWLSADRKFQTPVDLYRAVANSFDIKLLTHAALEKFGRVVGQSLQRNIAAEGEDSTVLQTARLLSGNMANLAKVAREYTE
jgi:hypothetical protein